MYCNIFCRVFYAQLTKLFFCGAILILVLHLLIVDIHVAMSSTEGNNTKGAPSGYNVKDDSNDFVTKNPSSYFNESLIKDKLGKNNLLNVSSLSLNNEQAYMAYAPEVGSEIIGGMLSKYFLAFSYLDLFYLLLIWLGFIGFNDAAHNLLGSNKR